MKTLNSNAPRLLYCHPPSKWDIVFLGLGIVDNRNPSLGCILGLLRNDVRISSENRAAE